MHILPLRPHISEWINPLREYFPFSTHILCPKSLTAEELALNHSLVARATTFMIDNPTQLFSLPDKLLMEVQTIISRR